jgi:hypothetical protein
LPRKQVPWPAGTVLRLDLRRRKRQRKAIILHGMDQPPAAAITAGRRSHRTELPVHCTQRRLHVISSWLSLSTWQLVLKVYSMLHCSKQHQQKLLLTCFYLFVGICRRGTQTWYPIIPGQIQQRRLDQRPRVGPRSREGRGRGMPSW